MSIHNLRFIAMASLVLSSVACGSTVTAPGASALIVSGISPSVGSTGGDTTLTIKGLLLGASVTFDGVQIPARYDKAFTTMFVQTPPHAAGSVNLVVRNLSGDSKQLTGSYTYVDPASFDFNGQWTATSFDGSDRFVDFTIQGNALVSVSCADALNVVSTIIPVPPPVVTAGAFSFAGGNGTAVTGRIVAPTEAVGTINVPACPNTSWRTYPK